MKLSIVTTLYCSGKHLREFHQRMTKTIGDLDGVSDEYELIFVDDGSPDNSLDVALSLLDNDPKLRVVELSKNHGHHRAMMIGLEQTRGKYTFLIDCDLEEAPENLLRFWQEALEDADLDLVYGTEQQKAGAALSKTFSLAFYKLFNHLSYIQLADNELVSRLMTRRYVNALLQYTEREIFMPGIWADVGFNRKAIRYEKEYSSESTYTFARKAAMAVDAVTSFSTKPLLYVFYLGFFISVFSILVAGYLVINKLFLGAPLGGWTSILVSLYLIGGVIIFCIGAVGLYLSRIFTEVKQRPLALIRKVHGFGEQNDN